LLPSEVGSILCASYKIIISLLPVVSKTQVQSRSIARLLRKLGAFGFRGFLAAISWRYHLASETKNIGQPPASKT
jgi:hypothetical protein